MEADRHQTLRVDRTRPDLRLDVFLRECYPTASRVAMRRLIEEGAIRVGGRVVKPTYTPRLGDVIEVKWPDPKPSQARPEAIPLEVLYEDAQLLVLNKPAGLAVHPSFGHEEHTLVNALLHHCAGQLSGIGGVARPGIVHRLDLDTSGCLVVAKDDPTHLALAAQFAGRAVEKIYHALVCGDPLPEHGEIRAAIARHPTHRKRMAVADGDGREAWTSYRVLERLPAAALVEARLHTGRTHQIRVHFQHAGFPLVGDATYGKRQNHRLAELIGFRASRQMLHARELVFLHPGTGRRMAFLAPPPEDFRAALSALRTPAP